MNIIVEFLSLPFMMLRTTLGIALGFAVAAFVVAIIILGLTEFIRLVFPEFYKKHFYKNPR